MQYLSEVEDIPQAYNKGISVKELSRSLFPYGTRVRILAMLTAYFDESGTHGDESPTITVGGFLSSNNQWERFSKSWEKMLEDMSLSCFHMTDLLGGRKEFKGWTLEMRDKAIERAFNLIYRYAMVPIAVGVGIKDYQESGLSQQLRGVPENPYAFCVMLCLQNIAKWIEKVRHTDPIAYVFKSGAEGRGVINDFVRTIQGSEERTARYRVGSLTFASKKDLLPLQAADVLAYITYTIGYKFVLQKPNRTVKQGMKIDISMQRLLKKDIKNAQYCGFYRKEDLLSWKHYEDQYRSSH